MSFIVHELAHVLPSTGVRVRTLPVLAPTLPTALVSGPTWVVMNVITVRVHAFLPPVNTHSPTRPAARTRERVLAHPAGSSREQTSERAFCNPRRTPAPSHRTPAVPATGKSCTARRAPGDRPQTVVKQSRCWQARDLNSEPGARRGWARQRSRFQRAGRA